MKYLLFAVATAAACPAFVEFFPDPTDVADSEGEFVEILLDSAFSVDSLYISMDGKGVAYAYPAGTRLVLVHDTAGCLRRPGVVCRPLGMSLPNSRSALWTLRAGTCLDSVALDVPKPGKSMQRRGATDDWLFVSPTPGYANPLYESGVQDCGLSRVSVGPRSSGAGFAVSGWVDGCAGADVTLEWTGLFGRGNPRSEEFRAAGRFERELEAESAAWVSLRLPGDDFPMNDAWDSLAFFPGKSPLAISEIHHCPAEPEPEWVEIYNVAQRSLPLSRFSFCGRGGTFGGAGDSILPGSALLVTKDSAELRSFLGFRDVPIRQVKMGILNNTGGTLSLCFDSTAVGSVAWDKSTVECPSGFSPLTLRRDNTPGFVGNTRRGDPADEVEFSLSGRIFRTGGPHPQVRVVSATESEIGLLDSAGRRVWAGKAASNSSVWHEIPLQKFGNVGVNYVSVKSGTFEKVVGIVLRP